MLDKEIWIGKKPDTIGSSGINFRDLRGEVFNFSLSRTTFGTAMWGNERGLKGMTLNVRVNDSYESIRFNTLDPSLFPSLSSEEEAVSWVFDNLNGQDILHLLGAVRRMGFEEGTEAVQEKMRNLLGL
jgi:hypothetical protein